jgi:hypothetical protein
MELGGYHSAVRQFCHGDNTVAIFPICTTIGTHTPTKLRQSSL